MSKNKDTIIVIGGILAWLFFGRRSAAAGQYKLTINRNAQGGITEPRVGDHFYAPMTRLAITAVPSPGWRFVRWSGEVDDPESPDTTILMRSNKVITVNFDQGVGNGGGGRVSPFFRRGDVLYLPGQETVYYAVLQVRGDDNTYLLGTIPIGPQTSMPFAEVDASYLQLVGTSPQESFVDLDEEHVDVPRGAHWGIDPYGTAFSIVTPPYRVVRETDSAGTVSDVTYDRSNTFVAYWAHWTRRFEWVVENPVVGE